MTSLHRLREAIRPPAPEAAVEAQRHLDDLTKPPGSLGRLEEIALRLATISGGAPRVDQPVVFTFAADHGVVAEGVSAYPQVVTAQMVENFVRGGAAINVLARGAGARVVVADFGVIGPVPRAVGLVSCPIAAGTANIARGPAMTVEQATRAIERGAALAEEAIDAGADLLATGEMGIGNTTVAAAITAAIVGAPPEAVTGRGTGIDDEGWRRKVETVRRALAVNRPNAADGLDVLARVGGFEIAGLVGVVLAGAARRVPVVLDGFISTAAGLIAAALAPHARHALFASHRSAEPGHALALAHLGLVPYLDLSLRLGEGTGAALFIHLARAASLIYREMATFTSAGVSQSEGASIAPAKPALEPQS
ncbi:MAG TPA: nicotinate-nucleotide--dimethylbenzimidazole phosphoribosyltransferase [Candidatus Acidoferrum sp.]|nr:nicotinate-nucleotide--dimethylbenzimidazole phosphoribosyltransferase [Candidatus Acidoferrum sp.]